MKSICLRLWPELKPFKFILILIILFGASASGFKSLISFLLEQLILAWETHDIEKAWQIPIAFFICWTMANIGRYFSSTWARYISETVTMNFRRNLMSKYIRLSILDFQHLYKNSGTLISRLLNDIEIINQRLYAINDIITNLFLIVFGLAIISSIDLELSLTMIIALPVVVKAVTLMTVNLRKYAHKSQKSMEDLTNCLKENLDGKYIIPSFNLENEMKSRFDRDAYRLLKARKSIIRREETAKPITETIILVVATVLLYMMGQKIFGGEMSQPSVTKFVAASFFLVDGLRRSQAAYIMLQQAAVSIQRMEEILNIPERANYESKGQKPFPKNWKTIEYQNVNFSFDDRPTLENINLKIQRGSLVSIVGPSGSGKTTLINLLERFYEPDSGQILIDGIPISEINIKDLRKNIALVNQDLFLFSGSIEENIQLGNLEKNKESVIQSAKLANAHDIISSLKDSYQSEVGERGNQLSGGQKQLITIARAVHKEAPILILDESTNALDIKNKAAVEESLNRLMKNQTSLVITHNLSTITQSNHIVFIKDGRILEQGPHESLITLDGEYSQFYKLQNTNGTLPKRHRG